tara:strand:+ start:784 stop:936 length:153 start_codon:yes stop_codon:yes gene_type:complete
MLFSFNKYWKFIAVLSLTWGFYALVGFEFTLLTLVSIILAAQLKDFQFRL